MPHQIINNLLNSGFERDAVVTTASGAKAIKCIYKNKYKAAKIMNMDVESSNPYMICNAADIPDVEQEDTVTGLEAQTLFVREVQPQGEGKLILQLKYD